MMRQIRQQPAWIALFIFILLCLWVGSGHLSSAPQETTKKINKQRLTKVQVTLMKAEKVEREVSLYGRTEPDRQALLRSEVKGLVKRIFVDEGQRVEAGQKLIALDSNDLETQIRSAQAIKKQREIELKGAKTLGQKGFQSESALAQAEANLEMAKAEIARLQLALDRTIIFAPFDGILNERHVEVGDLLREGDNIASVVDLDPLIVSADVTENWIQYLQLGQQAHGRLISGETAHGEIRYISSVSAAGTNTFEIEVEIANPDGKWLAGMSTELTIPLQQDWAIKITPAVLALDEQGNLGVKTVNGQIVQFTPINILKSDSDGVWLSGLGKEAHVITRGHGFVRHGDKVETVTATEQNQPLQISSPDQ